ncbi:conserved hypothetical protein [Verticillium alfalfae VaMs.102]|uniref:NmrA-like domain-containing protein n=1 Tax=Verticillium alfalfae (strain VaMs.102 / ATCC MYA-4576 / FGSC 10136) TaxID=526221 RepID=C9S991_VERA1|nr:conserved hypothetical protein [Verticillium alfalfae VaMs.102]EEY14994.1 conserved hypothetical protein [Verticillium alfalfae VaMs.102]
MATTDGTSRLITVVGATGNQGGSVARRFLAANFRVRAITRNPSSPAALALAKEGAEVVAADLDDPVALAAALQGANLIFSVTNYWEPFFRPDCRAAAEKQGITCRRFAYDVEVRQGKNIADAAAKTVDTLVENGFLVSTLSHAGPPDGTFQMSFTTAPDRMVPHFDPVADMGSFTFAVSQMPPGKAYMAEGTTCSWTEWIQSWGKLTGQPVAYNQVTFDEMVAATGEEATGIEVALMFEYTTDPGYDGGMDLLRAEDIRKRPTIGLYFVLYGFDLFVMTWATSFQHLLPSRFRPMAFGDH